MTIDIYRRLKQHRNNNEDSPMFGKAWVSYERLAVECATNRKTIGKHVDILERVGLINVERRYRNGKRNYVFTFNQPLSEREFRDTYPDVIERYFDALEALKDDSDELSGM